MKVADLNRQNSLRIKIPVAEAEVISIQIVQDKMKDYLLSLRADPVTSSQLDTISDLPQLLKRFALLVSKINGPVNNTPSLMQQQLSFYKQRQASLDSKFKAVRQQNILLLKKVSNKTLEIDQNQAEIFKLKERLQQKQKIILKLMIKYNQKEKALFQQSLEDNQKNQNTKAEIKIVVKEPKIQKIVRKPEIQQPPLKIKILQKQRPLLQRPLMQKEWLEEKNRLLKVIRQKDLKIYQLIQEMNSKPE